MKKILIVLAAIVSSSAAFAVDVNSSWSQILASPDYIVASQLGTSFGPKGALNACATATDLVALTPVRVCTSSRYIEAHGEEPAQTVCDKFEDKITRLPLKGTHLVCAHYEPVSDGGLTCTSYKEEAYTISLDQKIDVLYTGELYPQVVFTKSYTIPACSN